MKTCVKYVLHSQGHDDIVQCVYCGGCLKGWSRCTRQMESPYIQHIVNFPDCPFVRYHHNDEIELFSNLGLVTLVIFTMYILCVCV